MKKASLYSSSLIIPTRVACNRLFSIFHSAIPSPRNTTLCLSEFSRRTETGQEEIDCDIEKMMDGGGGRDGLSSGLLEWRMSDGDVMEEM